MSNETPDDRDNIYAPGEWRCPKCNFALSKLTIFTRSGDVGVSERDAIDAEPCPNDGTAMVRVRWRERAADNYNAYVQLVDDICKATGTDSLPAALRAATNSCSSQTPASSPQSGSVEQQTVAELRRRVIASNGQRAHVDALLAAVRADKDKTDGADIEERFAKLISTELDHYAQKIAKRVLHKALGGKIAERDQC